MDHQESPPALTITVPEAARRLGISRATVYRMAAARELRILKFRRAARVALADVEALVERKLVEVRQ